MKLCANCAREILAHMAARQGDAGKFSDAIYGDAQHALAKAAKAKPPPAASAPRRQIEGDKS